jgi:3-isopropylmalate/(R)-2-methylmalate dehydratase large subunit
MSIEGGARAGYVNPDETTFAFLKGRKFAPSGAAFDRAVAWWRSIASDANATYDDRVALDASAIEPTVTWGINPGQSVGIHERIDPNADEEALAFMGFERGQAIEGTRIDVAFIGSCTNGRLSDLEEAARLVKGRRVAPKIQALVVPGPVGPPRPSRGCTDLHEAGFGGGAAADGAAGVTGSGALMCARRIDPELQAAGQPRRAELCS